MIDLPETPRYWLPDGQPLSLLDAGFMPDPTEPIGAAATPGVVAFHEISGHSCLMLIGEPGLGKSTALNHEASRLNSTGALVHHADLSTTQDESVLRARIFTGRAWERWHQGNATLHLFLDSFDMALIRLSTVVEVICDGLQDLDLRRLSLRIACRTADRQSDLESWLRRHFGPEAFAVFELAPLRRRDVAEAARVVPDPSGFLKTVIDHELQPLAMTPMTLRLLLELASSDGRLPASRVELYERGCLHLCDEESLPRRRARRDSAAPSVAERFAVAQRLAGLMVLGACSGVGADGADLAPYAGGVELNDLLGVASDFEVSEQAIGDVIRSGLFASAGREQLHFAHQTYGEFLCGRWMAKVFSSHQLNDLLFAGTDEGLRVIPQLRETAGWVAAHSRDFADTLLDRDPAVLLRSDPFTTLTNERPLLVDALLRAVGDFEVGRFDQPVRMALEHLAHPELAEQLRSVLNDSDAPVRARELACDIVSACRTADLEDDLLHVALDTSVAIPVREAAVTALAEVGSIQARRQLVPLALTSEAADVDDELKGTALVAVWPRVVAIGDLIPALTEPKRSSLYGHYKHFLRTAFVDGLSSDELALALRAAANWPEPRMNPMNGLADAREQLMSRALCQLDRQDVLQAYAALVAPVLSEIGDVAPSEDGAADPLNDAATRHRLAKAIADIAEQHDLDGAALLMCRPALVRDGDDEWLVECLSAAAGTSQEEFWADAAAARLIVGGIVNDHIFEARAKSRVLAERTSWAFDAVTIVSAEADAMRERHRKIQQLHEVRESRKEPPFDVQSEATEAIAAWVAGDLDGYWLVMRRLQEVDRRGRAFAMSDPYQLPGWADVDDTVRLFLLENAQQYLEEAPVQPERWFDQRLVWQPAWAAYRALRLMHDSDHQRFARLPAEVWERWAPVIVGWPVDGEVEEAFNMEMIARLVTNSSESAAQWLDRSMKRDVSKRDGVFAYRRFRRADVPEIERTLMRWAKNRRLSNTDRAHILEQLLNQGSDGALSYARRLVTPSAVRAGGDRLTTAAEVATVLASRTADGEWARLRPLFDVDADFGRRLVTGLASAREVQLAPRLTEQQVEDLYEWLELHYPHREDPDDDEVHWISPREEIGRWRDQLLQDLVRRGTSAAVAAFDRLYCRFPDLVWLKAMRVRAAETARRAEWIPPTPADVLAMAQDHARRWITSDEALMAAVMDALEEYAQRLGGRDPQAGDLWDSVARRPKGEQEIARAVARFLKDKLQARGVFLAREPEVRPSRSGKGRGESIDIWVEAIVGPRTTSPERATVVIELKGVWNRELTSAMKNQLVDRYLDPPLHRHGIYLVAYFDTSAWARDGDETRYAAASARAPFDALRTSLKQQARDISANDAVVVNAFLLDCSLPATDGPVRSTSASA